VSKLEVRHSGLLLDRHGSFSVIACESCGFAHADPLPTEDELAHVYRHEYYSREKPLYLERAKEDLPWSRLAWDERLNRCEAWLADSERRLLDAGAGPGFFAAHAKSRGWSCLCVEPSRQAAAHARSLGLAVVEGFLEPTMAQQLGAFQLIHSSEVLEHLREPLAHLELLGELLVPGGLLCVSVPNDYNPLQEAVRRTRAKEPWWVAPPHHLNYFDHDSLARTLERVGFQPLWRTTTFPIDLY
jgi:SAM-dependent methyltransferase